MRIVIDTNVFLVIVPKNSPYAWVYDAFEKDKFRLLVTTEILFEYEEQLKSRYKSLLY